MRKIFYVVVILSLVIGFSGCDKKSKFTRHIEKIDETDDVPMP